MTDLFVVWTKSSPIQWLGWGMYSLYALIFRWLARCCHWERFHRLVPIQRKYSYLPALAHQIIFSSGSNDLPKFYVIRIRVYLHMS
jgi:hypothetical protein